MINASEVDAPMNASLRKVFLEYVVTVDSWNTVSLNDQNWAKLIIGLEKVVKAQENFVESSQAL